MVQAHILLQGFNYLSLQRNFFHFFFFKKKTNKLNLLILLIENSNLPLGVNQFVEKTQRVTTGSDGKITLQEV